jgi:hypothetical protein
VGIATFRIVVSSVTTTTAAVTVARTNHSRRVDVPLAASSTFLLGFHQE